MKTKSTREEQLDLNRADDSNQNPEPPVEIPKEALSREALAGIIENFILRDGTDYGAAEVSFEAKVTQIHRKIDKGEVLIVFDPSSESVTLITDLQWKKLFGSQ